MTLQVLRYFDYVFTGVFTFEMIIKVSYYVKMSKEMVLNHVNVSNGFKFKDFLWFSWMSSVTDDETNREKRFLMKTYLTTKEVEVTGFYVRIKILCCVLALK